MGISIDKLDFDPSSPSDNQRVGSFLIGAGGDVLTSTTLGGKEALDVNIAGSTGLGIYAEDSAAVSGDLGQPPLAVRQDSLTTGATSADGDYAMLKVNAKSELYVKDSDSLAQLVLVKSDTASIVTSTGNIDTKLGALSKAEDAAHSSGDMGIMGLSVRKDVPSALAGSDGDYAAMETDNKGRLYVNDGHNNSWLTSVSSIGTSAGQLDASPLSGRKTVIIQNLGAKSIYIGEANTVTTSSGVEIPKFASMEFKFGEGLQLWAISSGAANDVRMIEAA